MIEGIAVFILVLLLAWANGANDIPKGIATLVGSGASRPLRAIAWATLCTVAGGLAALAWGGDLVNTFSTLFTAADPAAGRSIVARVAVRRDGVGGAGHAHGITGFDHPCLVGWHRRRGADRNRRLRPERRGAG